MHLLQPDEDSINCCRGQARLLQLFCICCQGLQLAARLRAWHQPEGCWLGMDCSLPHLARRKVSIFPLTAQTGPLQVLPCQLGASMQSALKKAFAASNLAIADHLAQQAERLGKVHSYQPEELAEEYEAFMLTTKWVIRTCCVMPNWLSQHMRPDQASSPAAG